MKDREARQTAATNNILIHSMDRRLWELERRMDMLLRHLGLEIAHRTPEIIRKVGGGDE